MSKLINASIFVCQLSEPQQRYIRKKMIEYLTKEGYNKKYIDECINNVIDDRVINVEDIIKI